MVFIDIPDSLPLRPEAREALSSAIFLFDAGAPDFHAKLTAFLAQPIEEIAAQFQARRKAFEQVRDEFFQTGGVGAGARAAFRIEAVMRLY